MNSIGVVKAVTTFVVGAGTTKIVTGIIKNNTDPENLRDTVAISTAGFVIGSMAANAVKDYTDASIDEIVETYYSLKNKLKGHTP